MDVLWSIPAVNCRCYCGTRFDAAENWSKQVTEPLGNSHELNICNQHCGWEIKACLVQSQLKQRSFEGGLSMCGHLVDGRRMLVIQQCPNTRLPPFCHCNCSSFSGSLSPRYSFFLGPADSSELLLEKCHLKLWRYVLWKEFILWANVAPSDLRRAQYEKWCHPPLPWLGQEYS